MTTGPLAHIRVLDLTRVRAGPAATRLLADWGADVVKIEVPPSAGDANDLGGPRDGSDFQNLQRNRRSVTIDLKHPEGRALFLRLARTVDVVVENFRPDVKRRLGIAYEDVAAVNERVVYASVSGFGQTGPYAARPGFDQVAQGMTGHMSITGLPGQGPVRYGIPVCDLSAGVLCATGILAALVERQVSGRGQWVDTSLLQAGVYMLDFQATRWLMDGKVPPQAGNDHPTTIPTGLFRCSDGSINLSVTGEAMFARFAKVLGHPEWCEDRRFSSNEARSDNRIAMNEAIAAVLAGDTAAAWVERLNGAGVPAGPVYDISQVFADPQVEHLGLAATVEHPRLGPIRLSNQPVNLSRTPGSVRTAAPELGADTDAVLADAGLSAEEIARLRAQRVV